MKKHSPTCPRCGYDLSGQVAAYETLDPSVCPLRGICSECGLDFWWRDTFGLPSSSGVDHFERTLTPGASSFLRTFRRLPLAGRFWRWTRMEWPLKYGRLAVFSAAASVIVLIVTGAITMFLSLCYYHMQTGVPWRQTLSAYMMDSGQAVVFWPFGRAEDTTGVGSVFTYHWVIITEWAGALLLMVGLVPAAFELAPITRRKYKVQRRHVIRVIMYELPVLCLVLQCKTLLAMAAYPLLLILSRNGASWGYRLVVAIERGPWEAYGFILACALSMWWWYAACRLYLKIPRAGVLAISLVAVAALASLAICSLIPGLPGRMVEQIQGY